MAKVFKFDTYMMTHTITNYFVMIGSLFFRTLDENRAPELSVSYQPSTDVLGRERFSPPIPVQTDNNNNSNDKLGLLFARQL